jgi:hypothetical protein
LIPFGLWEKPNKANQSPVTMHRRMPIEMAEKNGRELARGFCILRRAQNIPWLIRKFPIKPGKGKVYKAPGISFRETIFRGEWHCG